MSTSTFSEKAMLEWLKSLTRAFQTIKFDKGDDNLLIEKSKIEEQLNNVKNLFSAHKDREQKLLHHFADSNVYLRKVADYGNISLMLAGIDSDTQKIEELIKVPRAWAEDSNRIPEGQLHVLLKRLRNTIKQNITDHKNDPLLNKFNKTEANINYIADLFFTVNKWEQELLGQYKELDHYLHNFDSKAINDKVNYIHEKIIQIELLAGGLRKRMDGSVTNTIDSGKALSALQRSVGLTIINKNADEPLIVKLSWFEEDQNKARDIFFGARQRGQKLVKQLADLDDYLGKFGAPYIKSLLEYATKELRNLVSQLRQISSAEHKHEHTDQTQKTPTDHPHPQHKRELRRTG